MDVLELGAANCGCGGLTGPGVSGVGDCCLTFSRVKHDSNAVSYIGKKTTLNTTENYEWGYKVKKDVAEVEVRMVGFAVDITAIAFLEEPQGFLK
jgi:hypothetical protein